MNRNYYSPNCPNAYILSKLLTFILASDVIPSTVGSNEIVTVSPSTLMLRTRTQNTIGPAMSRGFPGNVLNQYWTLWAKWRYMLLHCWHS